MLHEGNLSGRGGTGLKQNLVVREEGWVQFVVFGLECTAPRNDKREHEVSPNIEQGRVGKETIERTVQGWFLEQ